KGIVINLFDTAGIRESDDIIESIGINKSIKKMEEADLILMVYDSSNVDKEDEEISSLLINKKIIKVYNKSDLIDEKDSDFLYISALKGDINILKDAIISKLNLDQSNYTTPSINNARELGILENIKEQLLEIKSDINLPIDLLASRLKEVLNLILSITGEDYDFDMISEIFSRFCVGK
ncbi:MAG: 50S ribosome-binding GTPase, partial [Mollicutes bacterium]|nr:50S ribosome-binding GTPase [Mollicutes bacterium]